MLPVDTYSWRGFGLKDSTTDSIPGSIPTVGELKILFEASFEVPVKVLSGIALMPVMQSCRVSTFQLG